MWDLQSYWFIDGYWKLLRRDMLDAHILSRYIRIVFEHVAVFAPPGPRSWDRTVESRYDQNASQPTVYESTARTSAPQPVSSGEGAVIWTMVIMLYSIHIPLDSLDSLDSIFQGKPGGATNNEGFPWISYDFLKSTSLDFRSWCAILDSTLFFLMIKQRRDQIPKASLTNDSCNRGGIKSPCLF